MSTATAANPVRLRPSPWPGDEVSPGMSNIEDAHERYRLTNRRILVNGRGTVPVSGEMHYSRVPRDQWLDRLRLMKSGGVTVVATYIFWIHHQPQRGEPRFDDNLDVAAFVDLCGQVGLDVVLRIGPWCHGEVRNGGFPDWVQASPVRHRTDDPAYLALVETWFAELGRRLSTKCGPTSHIIGIQLENELYDQPEHIRTLKRIARNAGLSAPIWTATAWGGAVLPAGEVLPLFGGYGDGFWVDADADWDISFREHYFFGDVWDDPGIGADLRDPGADAVTRAPSASPLFPPATCELGGGMATAYHRRPRLSGADVAAVAHTKLGNGSAWQGYYMYVGGSNPPGPQGTQESHATAYPNDLPRFDYDFHAPVGSTGRLAPAHAALRVQHAFLEAFGEKLTGMPSSLPDTMPDDVFDTSTPRVALRSDGVTGFVFVSWHQPHAALPQLEGFSTCVDVAQPVTVPSAPIHLPAGTIATWPVNLELGGIRLRWATGTPVTLLPGTVPTLVLLASEGIPVEWDAGQADVDSHEVPIPGRPGARVARIRAQGAALDILVLPPWCAEAVWVIGESRRLVLSEDPLWEEPDGRLGGRRRAASLDAFTFDVERRAFVHLDSQRGQAIECLLHTTVLSTGTGAKASYGERAGRASAPSDADFAAGATRYLVELPRMSDCSASAELEIRWAGDVARLVVDGAVRADRFWDGSTWVISVRDELITERSHVVLEILGMHPDARIGLASEAEQQRRVTPGELLSLESVSLVDWTTWTEAE